jgi:hypothetical protein
MNQVNAHPEYIVLAVPAIRANSLVNPTPSTVWILEIRRHGEGFVMLYYSMANKLCDIDIPGKPQGNITWNVKHTAI